MAENTKRQFVIDASFVLAFLLPDEKVRNVDLIFERYARGEIQLISTALLPYEVLNALKTAFIQKRLDRGKALRLANYFLELNIRLKEVDFLKIFKIAESKNLTIYDASYLQLSISNDVDLLSLDKRLNIKI